LRTQNSKGIIMELPTISNGTLLAGPARLVRSRTHPVDVQAIEPGPSPDLAHVHFVTPFLPPATLATEKNPPFECLAPHVALCSR